MMRHLTRFSEVYEIPFSKSYWRQEDSLKPLGISGLPLLVLTESTTPFIPLGLRPDGSPAFVRTCRMFPKEE